ncbi:major type 1 subunit fimbrin (pilin) [Rhodanobacter sp. TND4EL1]
MKKTLLSTALVAVMAAAGFAPQSAGAATNNPVSNNPTDGTISISGQVIAQTCKVDGQSAGTADAKTVNLPDVLTSQLSTVGATAGDKPFSIAVTGCDAALSNVHTYFTGTNIDPTSGRLTNATGNATGVQVQLLNGDNTIIALNSADGSQNSKSVNLVTGAATLNYKARYYASSATVGAGSVTTSVAFTMVYQ